MPTQELETPLRDLLAQVLDVPAMKIGPGLDFQTTAGWSSLKHMMLVSQLEDRFGVMFTNEEIGRLNGYDAALELLARRGARAG
jgi:acyl carrier protein